MNNIKKYESYRDRGQADRLLNGKRQNQRVFTIPAELTGSIPQQQQDSNSFAVDRVGTTHSEPGPTFSYRKKNERPKFRERNNEVYAGSFFDERKKWKLSKANGVLPMDTLVVKEGFTTVPRRRADKRTKAAFDLHQQLVKEWDVAYAEKQANLARVQTLKESTRKRRMKREDLEKSLGIHFTRSAGFTTRKKRKSYYDKSRSFFHPEYNLPYHKKYEENKHKLLVQQLHRERQREKLKEARLEREILEENLGTIFATRKRKSRRGKSKSISKDRLSPNRKQKMMKELNRFDEKLQKVRKNG